VIERKIDTDKKREGGGEDLTLYEMYRYGFDRVELGQIYHIGPLRHIMINSI
jgi:hypothetical protein